MFLTPEIFTTWGKKIITSGYATWFTARGAIRITHYGVIDDVITRNYKREKNGDHLAP